MNRTLEPELMEDDAQVQAYAAADFSQENQSFVDLFREYFPEFSAGHVLDLGCGPGDIPIRLARAVPGCRITAVDASSPMIRLAEDMVRQAGLSDRITFRCERFQDLAGANMADAAMSNSLLHHVPNPLQFWHKIRLAVKPGSPVLVMDLLRPESPEEAQAIVDRYASEAPDILRRDFYHSLLASFTEDEISAQLAQMNLTRLIIDVPDDRHWVVGGLIH
ncbi:MAG: class I SAM-dependent methyltransferase [Nitrospirota bacterium]|nr:class I SAM-dependent methyltransferase [Nitrospirota bacterium]MDP2383065.1 class I SAM-dependent methyltransferase [Nitrospirota bacterium]MDP3595456.1 class I SAM-dependent methyltransferase [Nitrospirota bacterium]